MIYLSETCVSVLVLGGVGLLFVVAKPYDVEKMMKTLAEILQ